MTAMSLKTRFLYLVQFKIVLGIIFKLRLNKLLILFIVDLLIQLFFSFLNDFSKNFSIQNSSIIVNI
jgi:hypothetical protein